MDLRLAMHGPRMSIEAPGPMLAPFAIPATASFPGAMRGRHPPPGLLREGPAQHLEALCVSMAGHLPPCRTAIRPPPPGMGPPFSVPMQAPTLALAPRIPQPLGPYPTMPCQQAQQAPPTLPVGLVFTQEELDMVLYGYARNKNGHQLPGHALSGLRIGQLSYGIERILGGSPAGNKSPVSQSSVAVDPATLDLPEGLELYQTTFAGTVHYGVFCSKALIPRGTRYGPFHGKQVNTSEVKTNDDNSFMWEIFQEGKLSHFVDGRGASSNWMAYVNCARYAQEQNLLAIQVDGEIYYETCKDIASGTELLVWYGECYLQFMGIPVALKDMVDAQGHADSLESSEGFQCERCGKVFAYKYYRDKHLKYTRCVDLGDRKFPCHLCTRSFEKRDRLRIHILHVHEKHRPHKCNVCNKSFSQSSSLNKHMRVHSGERPYKCVYCSKAFTASSILRTHIRQHSGEKPFKCKHCGKAFASHAAHDSHVRRTHTRERPVSCSVCSKTFSQSYELRFHMSTHQGQTFDKDDTMTSSSDLYMTSVEEHIDVVGEELHQSKSMPYAQIQHFKAS